MAMPHGKQSPRSATSSVRTISRRDFFQAGAATAAFTIVAPHVLGGPAHVPPSDTVLVALVGAGGRGQQNARELMKLKDVKIVAVADPAERWDMSQFYYQRPAGRLITAEEIEKHYSESEPSFKVSQFLDHRELLTSNTPFDAVLCATPDHSHAHVCVTSMRAGKHVYCEKPLTHSIAEARMVAKVAEETKVATQMGNQGHSSEGIRRTVELLRAKAIGNVDQAYVWVGAKRWNPAVTSPPTQPEPIPAGFDWDRWCGPRHPPAYSSLYTPVAWREYWKFGCGAMGDFGCHDLDSSVWAYELESPKTVRMFGAGTVHPELAPYGEIGYFDFGPTKWSDGLKITWYSGGLLPPRPEMLPADVELGSRGVMFVGSDGVMVCGGAGGEPVVYPQSRRDAIQQPAATIPRSKGHHRDWIDAIKGGPPASSNFAYGARLTEITLIGVLALQRGGAIDWESQRNDLAAGDEPALRSEYRSGWELG